MKIAFFGTPQIAVWALEELDAAQVGIDLIVTNPDQKQGRGLELTPSPVKTWALERTIRVLQPESLKDKEVLSPLLSEQWDFFVVVAYGKLMPEWLIKIPKYGTINLHPSLLPKLRGASPIRTSILEGMKDVGVTIIRMDEKMDHGPILAQMPLHLPVPIPGSKVDFTLAKMGGALLADVIQKTVEGTIEPKDQNHAEATYTKKITKEMAEISLDPFELPQGQDAYDLYLKICAFDGWPGTFFFHNGKRIKITEANLSGDDQQLHILKVIPEGKKEISFETFLSQQRNA